MRLRVIVTISLLAALAVAAAMLQRRPEVLGEIGPAATNAVPMLLAFLSSNPPHDDRFAAAARTRIAPELAATVLKDKSRYWRRP